MVLLIMLIGCTSLETLKEEKNEVTKNTDFSILKIERSAKCIEEVEKTTNTRINGFAIVRIKKVPVSEDTV